MCKKFTQPLYSRKYIHKFDKKMYTKEWIGGCKKKLIKNINDLIETLECDELKFLEVIEPEYEKEIEINMSKKHCM